MGVDYNLVSSKITEKGIIIHHVLWGESEQDIKYSSVRVGASFPSEEALGAFCVVGQEADDKFEVAPGRLFLLDEWEYKGLGIDSFWDKVTDSIVLMSAAPLYLDVEDEANLLAFQNYCDRRKLSINYQAAPFGGDFFIGLATANDWLREGRLELDKASMVRTQLKSITRNDLKDFPEKKFPLVNALRHVLSGFRKFPPVKPFDLNAFEKRGKLDGWMAY